MKHAIVILLLALLPAFRLSAGDAIALPVEIKANDPNIRYIGRFDMKDGPRCSWSASTMLLKFKGTALNVKLSTNQDDFYQIEVDGKPTTKLAVKKAQPLYTVASGLAAGEHTVALVKCTEMSQSVTKVLGFQIEAGALLPLPARTEKRIEVYGDSITCGYGNEGPNRSEHFKKETENAYFTYGPMAARELNAECSLVSWSGRKMWPDYTIPSIYDCVFSDSDHSYNFSTWIPQAVVINLCTNDWSKGAPDEQKWTEAYKDFIKKLRTHYPDSHVFCVVGSMMGGKGLKEVHDYLNKMIDALRQAGDQKIHYVEFEPQKEADGIGSDWHPSIKTHEKMALKLAEALKKELNW